MFCFVYIVIDMQTSKNDLDEKVYICNIQIMKITADEP